MAILSKLLQTTEEEKKAVLQNYNITEEEVQFTIESLKEWYRKTGMPNDGKEDNIL